MKIFFVLCWSILAVGSNPLACWKCESEFCPSSADDCALGVIEDPCGCCSVGMCILGLGSRCLDFKTTPISSTDFPRYSSCGESTICQPREDLAHQRESICRCSETGRVCGSDNQTYSDICTLRRAIVSNELLFTAHQGACAESPRIAVGPVSKTIHFGHNIALDCEAHGVPVPTLTWLFHGRDGPSIILPADDESVVVQTRGGPETDMLTSWVQVLNAGPHNTGAYVCVAENQHGVTESAALITLA